MKPGDIIVYLRKTWQDDADPDEHNYIGLILKEEVIPSGDRRMPPNVIKTRVYESLGVRCYYIMWNEGGRPPNFNWNRADYIEKWYELA